MHLRLLDKYVLKELLYPFIFGVASFSSIFIASSLLFKIVQYITTYGAPIPAVARLFFYSLPEIVNYTFPMAVLLATLMAFGKLSGNSEIVAMKSGGVSYYRIVAPGHCSWLCSQYFLCHLGRESGTAFQTYSQTDPGCGNPW